MHQIELAGNGDYYIICIIYVNAQIKGNFEYNLEMKKNIFSCLWRNNRTTERYTSLIEEKRRDDG